jgi:hypothetical protein
MHCPVKFGDIVKVRYDDNYQQEFYQKAIASGKVMIEIIKEGNITELVNINDVSLISKQKLNGGD